MSANFTILPLTPHELTPPRLTNGSGEQTNNDKPAWMHSAVTLNANGHSLYQIATSLQKDVRAVSQVLNSPWAKEAVLQLVSESDGMTQEIKTIKQAAKDALVTLQELLHTAPPAVRLAAAKELLDRALGKAAQKIQYTGPNKQLDVREEMEQLKKELRII